MMVTIEPIAIDGGLPISNPGVLASMMQSLKEGRPLAEVVQTVVRELGFRVIRLWDEPGKNTIGATNDSTFGVPYRGKWLQEYDQKATSRLILGFVTAGMCCRRPLIGDATVANGDAKVERFLERAASYGIGSGIAIYLRDNNSKVMVALSGPERYLTEESTPSHMFQHGIHNASGELVSLGLCETSCRARDCACSEDIRCPRESVSCLQFRCAWNDEPRTLA
jgi:hypothetical protein